jgi:transposase
MDFGKVIIRLLGLQGIELLDVKLFTKDLRAEIIARQNRDEKSCCTRCGKALGHLKEWVTKENIKLPPLGIFQHVRLRLKAFRAWCQSCRGFRMAKADWIHPRHRSATCGFIEIAGRLMEELSCEAAGRYLGGIHSMQMMRFDRTRMKHLLQGYKIPDIDHTALSADEVHHKTIRLENRKGLWAKRWDREWITNLVSLQTDKAGDVNGKVLFNAPGRGKAALRECLSVLSAGQKLAVEWFCCDMHQPFIRQAQVTLPNAKICVDRFHVTQEANRAFDQVRKSEFKRAETKFQKTMLLPSRRFILVSREKDLSQAELSQLERLRDENKNIHTAMLLVEYLHRAFDKKTVPDFRATLTNWYRVVRDSGLEPFRRLAGTIRRHRRLIENYIISRLTTAVSEGLNNKIKALKRAGYGYKGRTYFRHKILQRAGYLNHYHLPTNDLMYNIST